MCSSLGGGRGRQGAAAATQPPKPTQAPPTPDRAAGFLEVHKGWRGASAGEPLPSLPSPTRRRGPAPFPGSTYTWHRISLQKPVCSATLPSAPEHQLWPGDAREPRPAVGLAGTAVISETHSARIAVRTASGVLTGARTCHTHPGGTHLMPGTLPLPSDLRNVPAAT